MLRVRLCALAHLPSPLAQETSFFQLTFNRKDHQTLLLIKLANFYSSLSLTIATLEKLMVQLSFLGAPAYELTLATALSWGPPAEGVWVQTTGVHCVFAPVG